MHIEYPPELPVSAAREELMRVIGEHQVVIVAGATGSGKTTQLPKMCLEIGRTRIGHTQPRRIAARTIAERIAHELDVPLGAEVGYAVRFTDTVSAETRIKVMTDGILLAEIHRDRDLTAYDTIIIDEAHERSLTIDFLLGYLKRLLPRRPDLKVIITSATIDPESFSRHFDGAPIIEVSGRTFPVDIRYRPLVTEAMADDEDDDRPAADVDPIDGIAAALGELERDDPGDVLVFLSGEQEIRDAQDALTGRLGERTEVLPLYGRLSAHEQHRVFERSTRPGVRRRVVLATNVAETSLTVPGIRHVIDTGTARISRYSPRAKIQRLPIEPISQASANQRAGRAGRTAPGIAIRLYGEDDFAKRPEYTDPEILRTGLAAVILQAASLGLGDLAAFPFIQPPDSRGVRDGKDLLTELGAIDAQGRITKLGRTIARLPVDPRFARMIVAGERAGVAAEVIAIVAGLSIQDPRERPLERREAADLAHRRFTDPTSDFISLLNLWRHLEREQSERSSSAFRRMCKAEYLNFLRIREWQDVARQLARALGLPRSWASSLPESSDAQAIHRAILTGLLSQLGVRDREKRDYLGARGARFVIHPGSGLAKRQPDAVMAAELVETSRVFARTVAAIDPSWAEEPARALVKRSLSEPRWQKSQGAAVADERVTLFGVPIIARRTVQYARFDQAHARELFIQHALVDGDWRTHEAFDRDNRRLREELEELEERQRRRDVLVDDDAVRAFYDQRVPADVVSTRTFEGWWRRAKRENPTLLTMTREDLVPADAEVDEEQYPAVWRQGGSELRLGYRFEPGAEDDGVTVKVPLPVLPSLSPVGFDWLVPGQREALVVAMIRTLPKAIRRHVVPAADWAKRFLAMLPDAPDDRSLADVMAASMRSAGIAANASDFDVAKLPSHLRARFQVEDERGRVVGTGTDLEALQTRLAGSSRASVARAVTLESEWERDRVSGFDTELPEHIDVRSGSSTIRAYPAYTVRGDHVGVQLHTSAAEAARAQREAVVRLLAGDARSPGTHVVDHLTAPEKLTLAASPYPSTAALIADALMALIDARVDDDAIQHGPVRTRADYERVLSTVTNGLVGALTDVVVVIVRVLAAAREADRQIRAQSSPGLLAPLTDMRAQLDALVFDGFVRRTGLDRLPRLVVYAKAISVRAERLADTVHRDRAWQQEVESAQQLVRDAGGTFPLPAGAAASLVTARWMVEELRISLFAQQLGTSGPVSVQRIAKALARTS